MTTFGEAKFVTFWSLFGVFGDPAVTIRIEAHPFPLRAVYTHCHLDDSAVYKGCPRAGGEGGIAFSDIQCVPRPSRKT